MADLGRNSHCPCGSRRKYKRCCQPLGISVQSVADDIEEWTQANFLPEMSVALAELWAADSDGSEPLEPLLENHLAWLLIDNPLAGGHAPAQIYAARTELLSDGHRRIARLIADGHFRLLRLTDVDPGVSLAACDLLSGLPLAVGNARPASDVMVGETILVRVVMSTPPILFGPAIEVDESWIDQLAAELTGDPIGAARRIIRCASQLRTPAIYTVEGVPMRRVEAVWGIDDPDAVLAALDDEPRLMIVGPPDDGRPCVIVQVCRSDQEIGRQAESRVIPRGALIFDRVNVATPELHGFGTFEVYEDELHFSAVSEARLQAALREVARRIPTAELLAVRSDWRRASRPTPTLSTPETPSSAGPPPIAPGDHRAGRGAAASRVKPDLQDLDQSLPRPAVADGRAQSAGDRERRAEHGR